MNEPLTKQLLLSNNFWVLNKNMVHLLGLDSAFLLSNFAEAETMLADKKGWFYQTAETVEKMTTLSRHKQDQCIKQLEEHGILEKDVRGMPAKRYFRIDYGRLTNLFVNSQQTRMSNSNKQVCKKSATNKEHIYKEHNKQPTNASGGIFGEITRKFTDNGFGLITPSTSEQLIDLSEDYTDKWLSDAMDVAITNNARNLGYVRAILKRWKAEGKDTQKKSTEDDKYGGIPLWE